MGKLVLSIYVTLDGQISGPDGDLSMLPQTPATSQYSVDGLGKADAIVLGRRTYEILESYWPTAEQDPSIYPPDLPVAKLLNALPKFVFSRRLKEVNWNATILDGDVPAEIAKLKERFTGDLVVLGGAEFAQTLMEHNLIDEYQLLVCPSIVGRGGKPLFKPFEAPIDLTLTKVEQLDEIVLLYYRPV